MSEKGTVQWSPDRSKIFVGLKGQEARPPRRDSTVDVEPVGTVDVWHWKDPYIQPVQMVRAQQERNRTFAASVLLAQREVVPIADPRMDRVQIAKNGNWAVGQDDKDYVDDWKPQPTDIYRVSANTGERTTIIKAQESERRSWWRQWLERHHRSRAAHLAVVVPRSGQYPDYWVSDAHFTAPQRLTNANPQQAQFRWGHRILFDYNDRDGHKLQGTLAIPDGYQAGQKLPMLVDFYENNSQNLNHYEAPRYANSGDN